jgi:hypothetical protein
MRSVFENRGNARRSLLHHENCAPPTSRPVIEDRGSIPASTNQLHTLHTHTHTHTTHHSSHPLHTLLPREACNRPSAYCLLGGTSPSAIYGRNEPPTSWQPRAEPPLCLPVAHQPLHHLPAPLGGPLPRFACCRQDRKLAAIAVATRPPPPDSRMKHAIRN